MLHLPVSKRLTVAYSINQDVIVRLKWGETEYKGRLISVDSYMNIQMSNTEEFIDMKSTGTLGQVLIRFVPGSCMVNGCPKMPNRCNNVLWISAASGAAGKDVRMEG